MPNFDTGHYFLTTLAPIKLGAPLGAKQEANAAGTRVSYIQRLRSQLAVLPTALQSPATERIGVQSPFARNRRTHLCRYVVINDTVYNGREGGDALVGAIGGLVGSRSGNPLIPQPVDQLNRPYLLFVADIDAVLNEGDPLPATLTLEEQDQVRDAYAKRLWETMQDELCSLYENCVGFSERVTDADSFAAYLKDCQVETTLPFNDYWVPPPKLVSLQTPLIALVAAPLVALVLAVLAWWLFNSSALWILGAVVATVICLLVVYFGILMQGDKPMPPGPYADLPSVLKSLYLQQKFTDFAIEHQGLDAPALHSAFGDFLQQHKVNNKDAPTQPPGVISSVDTQPSGKPAL